MVFILYSLIFTKTWTIGSEHCDQDNHDQLACYSCANIAADPSKHCSRNGTELYSNWNDKNMEISRTGFKNETRLLNYTSFPI